MIIQSISSFIKKHALIAPNDTIIVGLSGGPDSVFLLHMLTSLQESYNLRLIAAHLDHEWRSTSAHDAAFSKQIAQQLSVEFISKKISELDITFKLNGSKEELARRLRRHFFEQLQHEFNAHSIALGHHAQDQQETFFIRLVRGTSLSGLISMKPRDGFYIRPLLEINKNDILTYLHQQNIHYVVDDTNNSHTYLRNRIRHTVLPALHAVDNRFEQNFSRTLDHLKESEHFLDEHTKEVFNNISHYQDGAVYINLNKLKNIHPYMQNRLILHWLITQQVSFVPTSAYLEEIKRFLLHNSQSNRHQIQSHWSIKKEKELGYIQKKSTP